jgi:hypothetical protein
MIAIANRCAPSYRCSVFDQAILHDPNFDKKHLRQVEHWFASLTASYIGGGLVSAEADRSGVLFYRRSAGPIQKSYSMGNAIIGGPVGNIRLIPYTCFVDPCQPPPVLRISANRCSMLAGAALLRRIGEPTRCSQYVIDVSHFRLRLNVMPWELPQAAAWVAHWIEAATAGRQISPPQLQMSEPYASGESYLRTAEAARQHNAWRERSKAWRERYRARRFTA